MEISVRHTNLRPTLIKNLLSNGILLVSHLNSYDVARLMDKTRLSQDDCEIILAATKPKRPYYLMKASELMLKPFPRLKTLIRELDEILDGGIKCGHITEISGEAGSGKSNLCAQIGCFVMINKASGGLDGDVLFIHTEGEGKLKLAIKRFHSLASSVNQEIVIDGKLQVMNCANELELAEMVNRLPTFLDTYPNVRLILVDSMTCAFIQLDRNPDKEFYNKRSLTLTKIAKTLGKIAWDRSVAIVATNHVSYNFKAGQNKPALGKLWSHMCQTKIYLERMETLNGIARYAHVYKGAVKSPKPVYHRITNELFDISEC